MAGVVEEVIQLPYKWTPRADQMPLWMFFQGGGKRGEVVAHRRWGKDEVGLRLTSVKAHERKGNYWHMLPEYSQGRKAIWEAINPHTGIKRIDEAFPEALRASTRNTDMVIQLKCGSQWQIVGSDNYNSFVGSPPVGIVISEWALADPLAWAYVEPILKENGGWALFITSSRGNNHVWRMIDNHKNNPAWFTQVITPKDSGKFTQADLDESLGELIAVYGPEIGRTIFNQEYLCSREGAVLGAFFARQMEDAKKLGRITKVPHRPGYEVFTAWDLGVSDAMAIWFIQPIGRSFNVIDYYENTGYGLEHYAKALKGTLEGHEHRAEYVYGGHYMPHDAANREMGTEGEFAKSREESAEKLGIRPIMVVHRPKSMEHIMQVQIPAIRNVIPMCFFDEEKCTRGISALEGFHAKFDDKTRVLSQGYVHDWCSNGASALRTFVVGYEDIPVEAPKKSKVLELASKSLGSTGGSNNWGGL